MNREYRIGDLVHIGGGDYLFITDIKKSGENSEKIMYYFYNMNHPEIPLFKEKNVFIRAIDNLQARYTFSIDGILEKALNDVSQIQDR